MSAPFGNITIGQYYPVESPVHGLDPRVKIALGVAFVVILFLAEGAFAYLWLTAFALVILAASRVPARMVGRTLRPMLFILVFTLLIHGFTTRGRPLFEVLSLTFTVEGLREGFFVGYRLVLLIATTSLITLTTSPIALTDGLEALLSPLKRIGVPAHELAMMMTIALRFIPTLLEEADKIMKAQMARGADFQGGNLFRRAKNLVPLLVPLFVGAFRRADELAVAMEARCYRGGEQRTRLREIRLGMRDVLAVVVFALVAAGSIWLSRRG